MAVITVNKKQVNTHAELPAIGQQIPDFELTDVRFKTVSLSRFSSKNKLISIVPSVDSFVCANSIRTIDSLKGTWPEVEMLVVSADLPFAMARFAKAEKIKKISFLSMMKTRNFALDYGVQMLDGPLQGLAARALLVVDGGNKVVHAQLVEDIGHEPDYAAAEQVLQNL
jgi:thiol peroxidase